MDIDEIMIEGKDLQFDAELLENELVSIDQTLPGRLYIIPIRYRPIFPGIVTPLIISQGRFTDAIDRVIDESRTVGLVLIRDDDKDEVGTSDLFSYGTAVKVLKKVNLPDGGANVLINSVKRFRITDVVEKNKYLLADIEYVDDRPGSVKGIEIKALTREILSKLKKLSENNPLFTEEMKLTMLNVDEPGKIADFVTSILNLEKGEYQEILETLNIRRRLEKVLRLLQKEMEVLNVQKKIQGQINERIDRQQKDFFLREQLKAIKQELGIDDEQGGETAMLKKKADELEFKGEVSARVLDEIDKLALMDTSSSEYTVTRNYLDTVLALPWNIKTEERLDIELAERILNREHYGLDDVKKRILEFLAVRKLRPDAGGSIICLVGPPGVGKTSLGKSIAKAMNRKFFRLSLGGMRDEAEIKGHRRTYIGAMPGKIIQGLKIAKSRNPVFMLDEIDKLGQSYQGDPASALLEVLDAEQNSEFRDYYVDVPFDLSDVLFITTANTLDSIPAVLTDRMEVIRLSGYIAAEKHQIGRKYLLPKQLRAHGLSKKDLSLDKDGFLYIINGWAREAGVRTLERQIEKLCRKTASIVARGGKPPAGIVKPEKIREYLGPEQYLDEETVKTARPGVAVGLAWTSLGGATITIESLVVPGRKDSGLKITGQLGGVMTESVNIAYSHIRHLLEGDDKASSILNENTIHLHVPAGATPKDGPSAGITMAVSIYSLLTGRPLKSSIAMTGELSLTGSVLPVGGVKEKVIAARRAGIKEIILPAENRRDMEEIPAYIQKGLTFRFVSALDEVIGAVFKPVKRGSAKKAVKL